MVVRPPIGRAFAIVPLAIALSACVTLQTATREYTLTGETRLRGIVELTLEERFHDAVTSAAEERIAQEALESGEERSWRNATLGDLRIEVDPPYTTDDGRNCRFYSLNYRHVGTIVFESFISGFACRQADGTWRKFSS